jgi:hypothetical protein
MNSYKNKPKKKQATSAADHVASNQNDAKTSFQLKDNRSEAISQLKLADEIQKNSTFQLKAPIQFGKGGNKQPGSRGDQKARGVARAAHSYEAEFADGTKQTFQAGSHKAASTTANSIANRKGTTVSDVNQQS